MDKKISELKLNELQAVSGGATLYVASATMYKAPSTSWGSTSTTVSAYPFPR